MESGAFSYHRPYLQHLDSCSVMRLHEREEFGVGKRWARQRRRMANLFEVKTASRDWSKVAGCEMIHLSRNHVACLDFVTRLMQLVGRN